MRRLRYRLAAAVLAVPLIVVGMKLQHGPSLAVATLLLLYNLYTMS